MTLAFREVDDQVLPPLGHPTILIIDDDAPSRDSLAAMLSVEGFDVVTAASGDEGIALTTSTSPSLVLLDMELADSRGLSVFRRIAAVSAVPVIMVTALDDELDAVLALEAGAADHITKPPRPRELTEPYSAVSVASPCPSSPTSPRASTPSARSASTSPCARPRSGAGPSSSPARSSTCWPS